MSVWPSQSHPSRFLKGLLGMFLASPCPLCTAPSPSGLCPPCQNHIRRCRLHSPVAVTAPLPVLAYGSYQGHLRQAIAALKYQQKPEIAHFLGTELGFLQLPYTHRSLAVVPIPLHPDRLRQRGFNQADLLAKSFCRATRLAHCPTGLIRVRATNPQHSLNVKQRQENLEQAFALGTGLPRGSSVLLIDDIYTSGATATAAARTLQQQGIQVMGIAVAARAIPATSRLQKPSGLP